MRKPSPGKTRLIYKDKSKKETGNIDAKENGQDCQAKVANGRGYVDKKNVL